MQKINVDQIPNILDSHLAIDDFLIEPWRINR